MNILYNQQIISNNSIPRPESTEAHSWRTRPKDAHALGAEGRTPRPASRPDMPCYVTQDQDILCNVIYCVFLLMPFMLYMLYDIHRDEANKPRGRASDVSTISTCVFLYVTIYCPLPHPISVRTGWGYHCCVLVRLLALLLN